MVPVAVGSAASSTRAGGNASDSVTVKVWFSSSVVSAVSTVNIPVVKPLAMVTTPALSPVRSAAAALSPLSIDAVQPTDMFSGTASDSVTVKVRPSSSAVPSAAETSATLTVARSSLLIVPWAVAAVDDSCAFDDTPDSVTVNVSFTSTVVSSTVATVIVASVLPIATVTVPVFVDPRSAATAVSPVSIEAVQVAVTVAAAAADSVTVKLTLLPSVAAASAMLSVGFDDRDPSTL